eukprot:PITA_25000
MDRFDEPLNQCPFHPSQAVVGICSSCLRERLVRLARANYEQRRGLINYKPDSSSCGYLPFNKKNYDDIEGIRHNDQRPKIKMQNYKGSDEKKGRKVNFSGLRSFLGFLRKRDCRNNVSVLGRRENGLQRRQDRSRDVQDLGVASVMKTGCAPSTRRSVSERRLTGRPYFKGAALRRSTTYHDERDHDEMEDTTEFIRMKLPDSSEKK